MLFALCLLDGPLAIVSGGRFQIGDLMPDLAPDWAAIQHRDTIEVQLLETIRSGITWLAVDNQRL